MIILILKHQIITQLLNNEHDRFFIFSPSELKNAINCKGNANKHDILAKFKSDPIIESVKKSDLFTLLHKEDWVIEKDKILSFDKNHWNFRRVPDFLRN